MNNFLKCDFLFVLFALINSIASQQLNMLVFCQKDPKCLHLNDYNFQSNWQNTSLRLNQVQQLIIKTMILKQDNMIKIFSHNMPKIKSIDFFTDQVKQFKLIHQYSTIRPLTPKIIQTIFGSTYFQRLQVLDLQQTNLDYRHFQFLKNWDQNKTINLKELILNQNYLEKKAFKYLQKINFDGKLLSLGLSHNSLIQPQSINSVKKIIQPKNNSLSTSLKKLNLFGCSLNGSRLINILQILDIQILESLNIGYNALHHSKRYQIPFNNTIYEWISKQKFSSLQELALAQLDLDESHILYFQKIKLPSLKTLTLNSNFLNQDYFKQWILYQNMPLLQNIFLESTSITDECIRLLVEQNFTLQRLQIDKNKKLEKFIQYLAQIKIQNLKRIDLSSNLTNEERWEKFFEKVDFKNLEQLGMSEIQNLNNFFNIIKLEDMKNLKILHINKVDLFSGISQIFKKSIIFENLQQIKIQYQSLSQSQLIYFINIIVINCIPNLKLLSIPQNKCINVSKINIQQLPPNFVLQVQCMTIRKMKNISKFQVIKINFGQNFIQSNQNEVEYRQICKKQNISGFECNFISFKNNQNLVSVFAKSIQQFLTFSEIEQIQISSKQGAYLLKQIYFNNIWSSKLMNQYQNFIQQINQIFLQQVNQTSKQFSPSIQTEIYLPFLKSFKNMLVFQQKSNSSILLFFLLKTLCPELIYLSFLKQNFDKYPLIFKQIVSNSQNLQTISFSSCEINCITFTTVFQKDLRLPYLVAINFPSNKLESYCLDHFFYNHQFLRNINLNANFVQKKLFDVLSSNNIILEQLSSQIIRIGNAQFSKMAYLNTQFLKNVQMSSIGINGSGLLLFLQQKKKQSINKVFFPKIMTIDLDMNQLQSQPLKQLLDTEMHNLILFSESGSGNDNFINDILLYPNKINDIRAFQDYVYSINPNLDKRSTRHLNSLIIHAKNLVDADFRNLARLNLQQLNQVLIILNQVSDCQMLKDLLKICEYAVFVQIYMLNQKESLDDTCFSDEDINNLRSKHLKNTIVYSPKKENFIPKFINAATPINKYIQIFIIPYNYLEDQTLNEIVYRNKWNKTNAIYLHNNQFTDQSISVLLSQNISKIEILSLAYNQITSKCLMELINYKKLQKLEIIYLQCTLIGDQGIQILTKLQLPSLIKLYLSNIEMTFIGLMNIFQLKAPKLQYLRITNNHISESQFVQFILSQVYLTFNNLQTIDTNIKISIKNMNLIKKSLQKNKKGSLQIKSQVYHLQLINAAHLV